MLRFSLSDYREAQERLDKIFNNGRYTGKADNVCIDCKGKCCYSLDDNSNIQNLNPFCWDELTFVQMFEEVGLSISKEFVIVCDKKNKISCKDKPLLCKLHPFYPAKIHILEDLCDFTVTVADYHRDRAMCVDVAKNLDPLQLRELKDFFAWLYSFPENRLIYLMNEVNSMKSKDKEEFSKLMFEGLQLGSIFNKV